LVYYFLFQMRKHDFSKKFNYANAIEFEFVCIFLFVSGIFKLTLDLISP
jgi:hypothetical protein